MMELGFATDFGGQSTKLSGIEEVLQKISEAGFTHIHWCHEWDGEYLYSVYEMLQIKEWFEKFGLKAKALHASKGSRISTVMHKEEESRKDYTSANEYNRLAGVELIQNRMDLAYLLGANEIVLHMYVPYMDFRENAEAEDAFYGQVFKSFDELRGYAAERGIRICLETMLEIPLEEQYRQFDRIFARYEREYIGLCWDTGHTHVVANERMYEFAERYRDRIFSVHINDNLGGPRADITGREALTWCCDMHWIPGEGAIDWERVAEILAASDYELPLVMELNCYEPDKELFLRQSYEAGAALTEKILGKRQGRQ